MLVGPSKVLKQINLNLTYACKWVKNPYWPEANQLAISKRGQGFKLVTSEKKSSERSGLDLNSRPLNCKSRALTSRPCGLLQSESSILHSSF